MIYVFGILRKVKEILIESTTDYDMLDVFRNKKNTQLPTDFVISEGSIFYDVVGFQDTANFAISSRFRDLLLKHEITGWNSYKINIKDVNNDYYGFQIEGKCGKILHPKEEGFYTGLKFEKVNNEISDFCSPEETGMIICSSKVKDLLEEYKISNYELEDVEKYSSFSFEENY